MIPHTANVSEDLPDDTPGATAAAPAFSLVPLAVSLEGLLATTLPPRRRLLGNFLHAGDLGALIASRGSGKSWFTMLMSRALARAESMGDWDGPKVPVKVGIYDSEMPLEDLHQRAGACGMADAGNNVLLVHYGAILQARQRPLNLANLEDQLLLIGWARTEGIEVLFLDNLTTSVCGVEENGDDDFRDKVQPLLLAARAAGITLILVGHLGRNGNWRGASGKEDLLDWTLKLTRDENSDDGTLMVKSSFDKLRRSRVGNLPLRWTLASVPEEKLSVTSEPFQGLEAMIALVASGVTKPAELAEELGVSGGTISKWGKKGIDAGRLQKSTRSEWELAAP